jgi:hypothetical protein
MREMKVVQYMTIWSTSYHDRAKVGVDVFTASPSLEKNELM